METGNKRADQSEKFWNYETEKLLGRENKINRYCFGVGKS